MFNFKAYFYGNDVYINEKFKFDFNEILISYLNDKRVKYILKSDFVGKLQVPSPAPVSQKSSCALCKSFFVKRKGFRGSPSANRESSLLAQFFLCGRNDRNFALRAKPEKLRGVDLLYDVVLGKNLFGHNITKCPEKRTLLA